jgi:uncharacterized repeat protein (TIGR03803 family)
LGIELGSGNNVFKTAPGAVSVAAEGHGDTWSESILDFFHGGDNPRQFGASLIFDQRGNLYGTTIYGGDPNCTGQPTAGCGTVFKLIR